jgi:alpha-tubulin suppressor-like RCC1 family protein
MDNTGQLGDGRTSGTPSDTPVMVQGLASVSAAASGYLHTCAVSFGTVYCWGSNLQLQLGVGASNDPYSSNVPLTVIANAR